MTRSAWLEKIDRHREASADQVEAMVVMHHGQVIMERYYGGLGLDVVWPAADEPNGVVHMSEPYPVAEDASQPHNVKSVTKSVLATVVGIALDRGDLSSLDVRAADLLPEYFVGVEAPKLDLTLGHLLAMRSGLEWEENGASTNAWVVAPDLIAFTVRELPTIAAPGTTWNYSTADSHLLGVCLSAALGMPLEDYAQEHLFRPLGIEAPRWTRDPQGRVIGGSELFLTPRQMGVFGEMIRCQGVYRGDRVVSTRWVRLMLRPQPDVTAQSLADEAAARGVCWPPDLPARRVGYAQHWWACQILHRHVPAAVGVGGQLVVLLEDVGLVCVQVSSLSRQFAAEEMPYRMEAALHLVDLVARAFTELGS